MNRKTKSSAGTLDWLVKQARLTIFIKIFDLIALEEWWSAITGEQPANITSQPMNRIYKVFGNVDNNIFAISQTGNKIDLIIQNSQIGASGPEPMGSYDEAMISLAGIVKQWVKVKGLPPITRLAFGCNLLMEIPSFEEGYDRLKGHLPNLNLDAEKSKDFTYQINRPTPTKTSVENLIINRLSKWSLSEHQLIAFAAASDGVSIGSKAYQYVCQLDLDINTSIDFNKVIPKSRIQDLFTEFSQMGREIEEKGDIV